MKQAISYIRFSSAQQGTGSSTHRQQELVHAWLATHPDYCLSPLSATDEGISAFKGKHLKRGLGRVLEAIDSRVIRPGDVLLVESIDRLGRIEPMDMLVLVNQICKAGVDVVTLEDNITYDLASINNNLGLQLLGKAQQARQYSENLGRRVAGSYEKKRVLARAKQSIAKQAPYWIDSKSMTLKPLESEIVKQAIDLYIGGAGARAILIQLRAKYREELAGTHPSTVVRWFRSRALIGDWVTKGEVISDVFPPLIALSVFNKIQENLELRRLEPSPEEKYVLSGLVICAACNKKFHFRRQKARPTLLAPVGSEAYRNKPAILYANCKEYLQRGTCVNNSTWPYEVLFFILKQSLTEQFLAISEANVLSHQDAQLDAIEEQLRDLERQRARSNAIAAIDDSPQSLDRLQKIREKIKAMEYEKQAALLNAKANVASRLSYEEYEALGDAAHDAIQSQIYELGKLNDIELRHLLKQHAFSIRIKGKSAKSSTDEGTYQLLRRSQKRLCYVVQYETADSCSYYAVGKQGLILWRKTLEDLNEALDLL